MKRKYMIFISIIIFIIFLLLYLTNNINSIDNLIYNVIIKTKTETTTKIMKFITFFGSTYFISFLMIIFLILIIKNKIFLKINIIIMGDVIINNIVKLLVRRERPTIINLVTEKSFSFPSGHTMVSVTLYGFLVYIINKSTLNKRKKLFLNIVLITLITLIVISRIYLGAHYFSDCMAGIALALAYLFTCIEILERKKIK